MTPKDDGTVRTPPQLHSLLVDCLERIEADGETAIEAICAEHPELAGELREHVRSLRRFGMLAAPAAADGTGEAAAERIPERLGDFRLLERIGGGGMGVVYLAEQTSLKRRVALKLVRPEQLFFPGARARFAREVETIAQLQHPAIVPIHAVGEEQGIPFFAMERIEGCTLAAVVQELHRQRDRAPATLTGADFAHAVRSLSPGAPAESPLRPEQSWLFAGSWVDVCLRVVRQLADALAHAHERGVFHRDLKTTNVMATPAGRVVLLDFGLASRESASRLTRTGSFVGSLPYMPPEQVTGGSERLDARSDLYSLGVTLFELLTLRLPFAQTDVEALRAAILAGQPPPPRRFNAAISRDVETVCLTAMERDPARRYASANDFARDVDHLLARRPIEARRTGGLVKLARWAQRNPGGAVAAGLALVVLVGVPTTVALLEGAAARDLKLEQSRTLAQKLRAERHRGQVLDAVDRLLAPLLRGRGANAPELDPVRRDMLERALAVYAGFDAEDGSDPQVRREQALASVRLGDIHARLHQVDRSRDCYLRAIGELEALAKESPGDAALLWPLGHAHAELGALQSVQLEADASEASLRRAASVLDAIPAPDRDTRAMKLLRSQTWGKLAFSLLPRGKEEEGRRLADDSIELASALIDADPDDVDAREVLAQTYDKLGSAWTLYPNPRLQEGIALLEQSRNQYLEILRIEPGAHDARNGLARELFNHALGMKHSGKLDVAVDEAREAVRLMDELHGRFPAIGLYLRDLALMTSSLGAYLAAQGKRDEAHGVLLRACALEREREQRDPGDAARRSQLALALSRLAEVQKSRGELAAALASWDEAIAAMPADHGREYAVMAWAWRWQRVLLLAELGELDEAAETVDELLAADQQGSDDRRDAVMVLAKCAAMAAASPDLPDDERERRARAFEDEAMEHLDQAIARGFKPDRAWLAAGAIRRLAEREDLRARLDALALAASQ